MSPAPLGSSLMTRAPKSASIVEQKGPARAWLRSSTMTSSSGRRMRLVSFDANAVVAVGLDGGYNSAAVPGGRCRPHNDSCPEREGPDGGGRDGGADTGDAGA